MFNLFEKEKEIIKREVPNKAVSCKVCRCLLLKSDAFELKELNFGFDNTYFCHSHKPKYESRRVSYDFSKMQYYKNIEVDENGEPVGYVKKKQ